MTPSNQASLSAISGRNPSTIGHLIFLVTACNTQKPPNHSGILPPGDWASPAYLLFWPSDPQESSIELLDARKENGVMSGVPVSYVVHVPKGTTERAVVIVALHRCDDYGLLGRAVSSDIQILSPSDVGAEMTAFLKRPEDFEMKDRTEFCVVARLQVGPADDGPTATASQSIDVSVFDGRVAFDSVPEQIVDVVMTTPSAASSHAADDEMRQVIGVAGCPVLFEEQSAELHDLMSGIDNRPALSDLSAAALDYCLSNTLSSVKVVGWSSVLPSYHPSNMELSEARAENVLAYLQEFLREQCGSPGIEFQREASGTTSQFGPKYQDNQCVQVFLYVGR